jgi:hypothetical protein
MAKKRYAREGDTSKMRRPKRREEAPSTAAPETLDYPEQQRAVQ